MAKFTLKNVRLSYPSLFKKAEFEGVATKFEGTLLLDKDSQADQIEALEKHIDAFIAEKFPKGAPKSLKKTCLIDGDTKDYDGYENQMAFKGTNNKRPTLVNRDKTQIMEEDDILYAGCYVNAIVDVWYSDHPKGGKQILGNLFGVQFVKDGDAFGAESTADVDDFEDIENDPMFD